jgi:cell wall-associated NlpC family hydrolase
VPQSAPPASVDRGQAIVQTALKYVGVPYVYGGVTPAGWDCSGYVLYVYKEAAGISLPRSAAQQYKVGAVIPANQVRAGDIIFFTDTFGPGITHDGIALGDGRFVHARSEGYGTVISSLSDPYWAAHFAGARRP